MKRRARIVAGVFAVMAIVGFAAGGLVFGLLVCGAGCAATFFEVVMARD